MGEVDTLLAQVQTSVASVVNEATLASGTATAEMSTVTNFATHNAGGPIDEVVRHIRGNAQSMQGMWVQANQLVQDLLVLTGIRVWAHMCAHFFTRAWRKFQLLRT